MGPNSNKYLNSRKGEDTQGTRACKGKNRNMSYVGTTKKCLMSPEDGRG